LKILRVLLTCSTPLTAVNICEFDMRFSHCIILPMLNSMLLKHLDPNQSW
jgi:hypothetical protein